MNQESMNQLSDYQADIHRRVTVSSPLNHRYLTVKQRGIRKGLVMLKIFRCDVDVGAFQN